VLGAHPESGKELKVLDGRFGPYVTDGSVHATLPKGADPKAITLDEAVGLIDAKAAKGPAKGKAKRKAPAKKAAPKKATAKKS
jgi:DNA topoisomerase-1